MATPKSTDNPGVIPEQNRPKKAFVPAPPVADVTADNDKLTATDRGIRAQQHAQLTRDLARDNANPSSQGDPGRDRDAAAIAQERADLKAGRQEGPDGEPTPRTAAQPTEEDTSKS